MNFIEYPKINSIFKRDGKTKKIIIGEYSCPEFEYLKGNIWEFTEKVDGTNVRIYWNHEDRIVTLGGRTQNAQMPISLISKLNEVFTIDKMSKVFPECSVILFGEGYGEKIQKTGKLYKPNGGVDFILFDVLIGGWWLTRENVNKLAISLDIQSVPIAGCGTLDDAINYVRYDFRSYFGDFIGEGLVLRPKCELFARNRSRIITKIKYCDFE